MKRKTELKTNAERLKKVHCSFGEEKKYLLPEVHNCIGKGSRKERHVAIYLDRCSVVVEEEEKGKGRMAVDK